MSAVVAAVNPKNTTNLIDIDITLFLGKGCLKYSYNG
jgi:hypothetical protein